MSENLVGTTLLEEANVLIHGDRAEAYGSALQNAKDWAQMFSAATGLDVKPEHYPVALICTKLVREKHKTKRDNWRDIAGYVGVWGKMDAEKKLRDSGIITPANAGLSCDGPLPTSRIGRNAPL